MASLRWLDLLRKCLNHVVSYPRMQVASSTFHWTQSANNYSKKYRKPNVSGRNKPYASVMEQKPLISKPLMGGTGAQSTFDAQL